VSAGPGLPGRISRTASVSTWLPREGCIIGGGDDGPESGAAATFPPIPRGAAAATISTRMRIRSADRLAELHRGHDAAVWLFAACASVAIRSSRCCRARPPGVACRRIHRTIRRPTPRASLWPAMSSRGATVVPCRACLPALLRPRCFSGLRSDREPKVHVSRHTLRQMPQRRIQNVGAICYSTRASRPPGAFQGITVGAPRYERCSRLHDGLREHRQPRGFRTRRPSASAGGQR